VPFYFGIARTFYKIGMSKTAAGNSQVEKIFNLVDINFNLNQREITGLISNE
jgi:hypothetical protein